MRALLLALALARAPALLPPATAVQGWLEAVRRATPYVDPRAPRAAPRPASDAGRAPAWDAVRRLTAPGSLDGDPDGALAPWRDAARGSILQSFELLGARRAPRGAAVVTTVEWYARAGEPARPLERVVTEYLVAPVGGAWKVVDRRRGGTFADPEISGGDPRAWDDPAAPPAPR